MKRLLAFIVLVCMAVSSACAAPYVNQSTGICAADEVDISRVTLENGRLTGEIGLPQEAGNVRLLIDCMLPESFGENQQQKLTVSFQEVTKDMLQTAIESIGQSTEGGELRQFVTDPLNRMAKFEAEKELCYARVIPKDCAGHAKETEMNAARQTLRNLAAALNVRLSEDFLSAQRNTFADLNQIHPGESSASEQLIAYGERSFLHQEQTYGGRSGADDITLLRGMYEIEGLPVMNQRYWLQGGDGFGASSELLAAVNDEGTLVMAEAWGVPAVEKQKSLPIPERDWQTFLKEWVAQTYWPSSQLDAYTENSRLYGEVVHYGAYEVITRIAPCWVGREKFTLEPGWYGIVEKRLLSDDKAVSQTLHCVSAIDMAKVF